MNRRTNDLMGKVVGVGYMARHLTLRYTFARKRERHRVFIAMLHFELRVIYASAIQPRTGPGLEATDLKA